MLSAFGRFTRPHTIIATTIQVVSLYLIAGGSQVLALTSLGPVLVTLMTCLALNIYIVGLNQITDVEIDRINKPRLPLASSEMTMRQGWIVVLLMGLVALVGGVDFLTHVCGDQSDVAMAPTTPVEEKPATGEGTTTPSGRRAPTERRCGPPRCRARI